MHNHAFTYSTKQFTPSREITDFVKFLSKDYYSKHDFRTVELIRQAIGEFTNDRAIVVDAKFWSVESMTEALDDTPGEVMNEQYTASTENGEKIFTLLVTSKPQLDLSEFAGLPNNTLPSAFAAMNGNLYAGGSVMFSSIRHQFQNLVRSLSDRMNFKWTVKPDAKDSEKHRACFAMQPVVGDEKKDKPTFQVLLVIHLPNEVRPVVVPVEVAEQQAA